MFDDNNKLTLSDLCIALFISALVFMAIGIVMGCGCQKGFDYERFYEQSEVNSGKRI